MLPGDLQKTLNIEMHVDSMARLRHGIVPEAVRRMDSARACLHPLCT